MIQKLLKVILASLFIFLFSVHAADTDTKKFSQQELDQMLAPIALYPDALLSQILMATTYPSELQEAIAYSKANPDEKGDDAVKKVQDKGWDASVASLVAFPQVLEMLGKKPDWTKNLGDAFLAEPKTVMSTVQTLRKKAKDSGNLKTTKQQKVEVQSGASDAPSSSSESSSNITITPTTNTVYVPVYNPTYVYGPWMYPSYPPFFYYPPSFNPVPGFIFGFGVGIIASNCLWGGFNWYHRSVNINVNRYNHININKINSTHHMVNWNHGDNRLSGSRVGDGDKLRNNTKIDRTNAQRDQLRDNARNAMKQDGIDPRKELKNLSGSKGDAIREKIGNHHSNAFNGISKPRLSQLQAKRGSFSRGSLGHNAGRLGGGGFHRGGGFHGGGLHGLRR
jgi:hypothetical protein